MRRSAILPDPAASWYAGLVAGALPVLLLGFAASALANRPLFALWALALALAHALVLRRGMESGRGTAALLARQMFLLAAGGGLFAVLVGRYGEDLDQGLRALLGVHQPWLARPGVSAGGAGLLALLGAGCLGWDRLHRNRDRHGGGSRGAVRGGVE